MGRKLKVVITNKQNEIKIPSGIRLLIRRCCHAALDAQKFEGDAEVSVMIVDNQEIAEINNKHRDKAQPTDVLSFPLGENGAYDINPESNAKMLGDIVISIEKAVEQSQKYGHSLRREMAFLTVHAMLHLLGYEHEEGGLKAVQMREKEEEILAKLGLPRGASYVMIDEN